jgi:hypothetical protein
MSEKPLLWFLEMMCPPLLVIVVLGEFMTVSYLMSYRDPFLGLS